MSKDEEGAFDLFPALCSEAEAMGMFDAIMADAYDQEELDYGVYNQFLAESEGSTEHLLGDPKSIPLNLEGSAGFESSESKISNLEHEIRDSITPPNISSGITEEVSVLSDRGPVSEEASVQDVVCKVLGILQEIDPVPRRRVEYGCMIESLRKYSRRERPSMEEQVFGFDLPAVGVDVNVPNETKSYIDNLFERMSEMFDGVKETVAESAEKMSNIKVGFDFSFLENLANGFATQVKGCLASIGDWLQTPGGTFLLHVLMCFAVNSILRKYTNMGGAAIFAINIVLCVSFPKPADTFGKTTKWTWNMIVKAYNTIISTRKGNDEGMEEQTLEFEQGRSSAMKLILSVVLGCVLGTELVSSEKYGDSLIDTFLYTSAGFKRYKEGVEVTFDFVLDLLTSFVRFIGETVNSDYLKKVGVRFPEITDIAEELRLLMMGLRTGTKKYDYHTNEKLKLMESNLRKIISTISRSRHNEMFRREAQVLLDEVRKLAERSGKSGILGGGPRIEPVNIAFIGKSRTGKSIGADRFIYQETPKFLSKERLELYALNKDNEVFNAHADMGDFWDGYSGQFAVKFDDILQLKDSSSNPNPVVYTMINASNSNSWFLNMADLANKGCTPFTSRVVVCTDNSIKVSHNVLKSIVTPEAFTNRFDFVWWQAPSKEFSTVATEEMDIYHRKLDWNKFFNHCRMQDADGNWYFDHVKMNDVWVYDKHDWASGESLGEGHVMYDEVARQFAECFREKELCGKALLEGYRMAADDSIRQRFEELAAMERMAEQVYEDENPYQILGLNCEANAEQIVAAYRAKARRLHPDKPGGDPDQMAKLTWAFDTLANPAKRAEYTYLQSAPYDGPTARMYEWTKAYELAELMTRQGKEPINYEDRIRDWKGYVTFIEKTCPRQYFTNTQPSDAFIKMFSERVGIPQKEARAFFFTHVGGENTPLYDLIAAYKQWVRDKIDATYVRIEVLCKQTIDLVTGILTNKKFLLAAGTLLTIGVTAWAYFNKHIEETLEEQSSGTRLVKKNVTAKKGKAVKNVITKTEVKVDMAEEGFDLSDAVVNIANPIKRNLVFWTTQKDGARRGYFIFTRGKNAISVSHALDSMLENEIQYIWLHNYDGTFEQRIKVDDIDRVHIEGSLNDDDGYYYFKTLNRDFADIICHFAPEESAEWKMVDVSHHGVLLSPLVEWKTFEDGKRQVYSDTRFLPAKAKPYNDVYGSAGWKIGHGSSYTVSTKKGDCGLPWIICDDRSPRPFIAMIHVCGDGIGKGAGIVISRDSITRAIRHYAKEYSIATDMDLQTLEEDLPEHWEVVKSVPYVRLNSKSKLRRTPLFGTYAPCDKRPALLHNKNVEVVQSVVDDITITKTVKINVWLNARIPCGINRKYLNPILLKRIAQQYGRYCLKHVEHDDPWPPKVLNKYEACTGIPGFVKGLPRNTSSGWPWSQTVKKKFDFFGRSGEYEFSSKAWHMLDEQITADMANLKRGVTPDWVYLCFLKDELRSEKKVAEGKTRLVWGAPVAKSIVGCQLFKDWMRWLQENRIHNGIAIGFNPMSSEWKIIVDWLLAVSNNIIDGDFVNYDGSQSMQIALASLEACEMYYYNATDEERLARRLYIEDTFNPKSILTTEPEIKHNLEHKSSVQTPGESFVVQVRNQLPSGDPTTASMGSVNGQLIQRYARADILLKAAGYEGGAEGYEDDCDFDLGVLEKDRYIDLGDDHLLAVCEEHKELITQKSFGEAILRMDIRYTDAAKTGILMDTHHGIDDVQFCKRRTVRIPEFPGHLFAALDMEVVLQMPQWVEKGAPPGTVAETVDISLREMAANGYEVYKKWAWKMGYESRVHIGHTSMYAPATDSEEDIRAAWFTAVRSWLSLEVEYGM